MEVHNFKEKQKDDAHIIYKINKGLRVEGLFRLSGAASDVRQLSHEFDMGNPIDLSTYDIHAITGVVKKYLRSLPNPVIPHAYHNAFLRTAVTDNCNDNSSCDVKTLLNLVSSLPLLHRHLLCSILHLTSAIQNHTDINMMNPEALAVVLAPVSTGLEQSLPIYLPSSAYPSSGKLRGSGARLPKREEMDGLVQTNARWTYLWTLMIENREILLHHHEQLERETTPSPVYPPYDIFMSQFESEPRTSNSSDDDEEFDEDDGDEENEQSNQQRRCQQQRQRFKQQSHQQDQWWRGLFGTTSSKQSDQTAWSSASAGPRRVLRRLASVSSMRPPSLHHWR